MGYEASYDVDNDVLILQVQGVYTVEDARAFLAEGERQLRDKAHRQLAVVLSAAGKFDGTEARRVTAMALKELKITHMAVVNARPATRILGKILVNLVGGSMKAGFFDSTEDAIAWLKHERGDA